jgi:hypothetical protein
MDENALLRRIDGRFLAGRPRPRRALCSTGGSLERAVRLIAGEVVSAAEPGSCDLAVLRNPDDRALAAAARALGTEGRLYAEWWRPVPGGAPAIERRLRAAGFAAARTHWPWPPPYRGRSAFWLPLTAPNALRWFLRTRPLPASGLAASAGVAARVLWWALRAARLLVPVCATARVGAAASPLDAHGTILLTGGHAAVNKVVAVPIEEDRRLPDRVVKLARVPAAEGSLEHEAAALERVHAAGPRPGIPRVIERAALQGGLALVESLVEGQPLMQRLDAGTHRALALQVTDLLAGLVTSERPPRSEWWERLVEPALAAVPEARARLEPLGSLPRAVEHRDCSPWNILVRRDGALALLDWERGEPAGLPGVDLAYFLAYAAFFAGGTMDGGDRSGAYAATLDPATPAGRLRVECEERYAAATGVAREDLARLRLLCWAQHRAAGTGEQQLFAALAAVELSACA